MRAVDTLKEDLFSYPYLMNEDKSRSCQVRVDACRTGHGLGGGCHDVPGIPAEKEYFSTELECKALHDILLLYNDVYMQGLRFVQRPQCFDLRSYQQREANAIPHGFPAL